MKVETPNTSFYILQEEDKVNAFFLERLLRDIDYLDLRFRESKNNPFVWSELFENGEGIEIEVDEDIMFMVKHVAFKLYLQLREKEPILAKEIIDKQNVCYFSPEEIEEKRNLI